MTVTINATNEITSMSERYEGVDYDIVTIKEINRRNGYKTLHVRIENGKRAKVFSSAIFTNISIQEETTGRYLLRYSR